MTPDEWVKAMMTAKNEYWGLRRLGGSEAEALDRALEFMANSVRNWLTLSRKS